MLDGLYDRLIDERLSAEIASLIRATQTNVAAWLNESRRTPHQSGKIAIDDAKIECLFVTLDKAEGYHERNSYHDYAIGPEIFHWQTQNNAGPDTPAGRRYIESPENGWRFFLFVRENKEAAYCALGPAIKVHLEGDRPMCALEARSAASNGIVPSVQCVAGLTGFALRELSRSQDIHGTQKPQASETEPLGLLTRVGSVHQREVA